jgi:vacuolar-type H+-ATPase catalytic subunit A/Vma1
MEQNQSSDVQTTNVLSISARLFNEISALRTLQSTMSHLEEKSKLYAEKAQSTAHLTPYQKLLSEHFSPDHTFKTLAETQIDPELTPKKVSQMMMQAMQEIQNRTFAQMAYLATENTEQHPTGSVFQYLSGTKFYEETEGFKKYLEHIELVRNTKVEDVLNTPFEVLGKFLTSFCDIFKDCKKTEMPTAGTEKLPSPSIPVKEIANMQEGYRPKLT